LINQFWNYKSAKEGAETILYASLSSQLNGLSGKYLEDSAIHTSSTISYNKYNQDKLWNITWKLLTKWTNGKSIDDMRYKFLI
jgi:hypothetical protein